MNFNYVISSSSSSSDDELQQILMRLESEQQMIAQRMLLNNELIQFYANVDPTHGGSVVGRKTIFRGREAAAANLFNDYFSENPTFNDEHFRRRFRMSRTLFLHIVEAVKEHDRYFIQRRNAAGKVGLSTLQKITAAFQILAYGVPADTTDEYIKIGKSTTVECVKRFCRAVVEIFGEQYLRTPTPNDVARLLHIGKHRGFPGMLGSLDCMHWRWKNCPTASTRQYSGQSGSPTIILEVVADYDLWIWHAYFGIPGSNNDINVFETSHLFSNLARGVAPRAHYIIQGKEYNMGYYLADVIYPKCATLVQTIREPSDPKKQYFAKKQEACRKDVERAFAVLQSRFAIVANPTHFWSKCDLHDIMTACIIMHNMIIEDERDLDAPIEAVEEVPTPDLEFVENEPDRFQNFLSRFRQIRNIEAHFQLQNALIDHLWEEYSNRE